jgi:phosphoribosylanthranilate isomerase
MGVAAGVPSQRAAVPYDRCVCNQRPCPQVKICGLTHPLEAAQCADLGADAIGVVFFPKSPRHVTSDQARAVVQALPNTVAVVGVFVNATFSFIMTRVEYCGLSMAQLHGRESARSGGAVEGRRRGRD